MKLEEVFRSLLFRGLPVHTATGATLVDCDRKPVSDLYRSGCSDLVRCLQEQVSNYAGQSALRLETDWLESVWVLTSHLGIAIVIFSFPDGNTDIWGDWNGLY